jgi:glycosyltransferase involved in cell wall biosynthesis
MKVALVYDRVNKWGGAERVLLALHELFPTAPLFTSVYNPQKAPWAEKFTVKPSFLQKMSPLISNHEFIPFLMPLAFEQLSFDEYDLVISVTSEAAKGIITKPHTKHICYCLTPTRYLWSGHQEYFKNKVFRTAVSPVVSYLKKWDLTAAPRPDLYIAASQEVKKRIRKYYLQDADVVYPPLSLSETSERIPSKTIKENGYFLIVSRFVPYKRIDLAITACNELKLPLKIIGSGREEKRLKKMAGPTIEFLGNVSDDMLIAYYKASKALLFPGLEDFGLTIIEAQKYKKPVIAFKGGGALETIVEGKTGIFFDKQDKDSLKNAIKIFVKQKINGEDCSKQAEKFSKTVFKTAFLRLVNNAI